MFRTFFFLGLSLCLCYAPAFAQSSYPTAYPRAGSRNSSRYSTSSRNSSHSNRSNSSASAIPPPSITTSATGRQTNAGRNANKSGTTSRRYADQAASSSAYRSGYQPDSSFNSRYGNPSSSPSAYRDVNSPSSANRFNQGYSDYRGGYQGGYRGGVQGGNQGGYQPGYQEGSSNEPPVPYNIMTPQCPITHSLVIPAGGGYIHTLGCPSVTRSRATFMYAEDAMNRGVKPTGTCPQCRAQLPSGTGKDASGQRELTAVEARAAHNEAVRANAVRRLEEQQQRDRVEKKLQEIEDNRRWDNHMAEWENKAPFYQYTSSYRRRR